MKDGRKQLVESMNEALNREISTAVRYLVQGSIIQGQKNEPLREIYRKEVSDEIGHAQYLADKIVVMGGTPEVEPDLTPPPDSVSQMIKNDVSAEEYDIKAYAKLAELADEQGEIELKLRMEEQAADESRHAEELRRMLGA